MTVRSESSVLYTRLALPPLEADVHLNLNRAGCPLIYHALLYTSFQYTVRSPCSVARTGFPSHHTRHALTAPAVARMSLASLGASGYPKRPFIPIAYWPALPLRGYHRSAFSNTSHCTTGGGNSWFSGRSLTDISGPVPHPKPG